MEKVIITQDQANAIEGIRNHHRYELERFKKNPSRFAGWLLPIKEMDVLDIEKAFRGDYEVEPEYKVGDWVVNKNLANIGKIKNIELLKSGEEYFRGFWSNGSPMHCLKGNLKRHATPEEIEQGKERRWWAEQGRKPWSLRMYDCLISKNKVKPVVVIGINTNFFRGETTIELNDGTEILKEDLKKSFDVLYFVKDRKDLKE